MAAESWLISVDRWLFLAINSTFCDWADVLMVALSSKWTGIPLYMAMLWFLFKVKGKMTFPYVLLFVLAIVFADQGSVLLFKETVQRLRPCHVPDLVSLVRLPTGYCGGQFGFVSSHAANVAGLVSLYLLVVRPPVRVSVALVLWALAVGYSRIYLGVHYPLDILCGFIWGGIVARGLYFSSFNLFENLSKRWN